ncbi:uncharacterized protein BDV17DRAFT_286623 [Aspergillus undulatus]|uniref:uncharacterized protein n=1 Tax=Aspergillus undulatus TaxID=1810928 RepID=UPI003CCCCB76
MANVPAIPANAPVKNRLRATYVHFKWPFADFHADSSFPANPPSFSLLRIDEYLLPAAILTGIQHHDNDIGCRCRASAATHRISGYGTYEALSVPLRSFADTLSACHSSAYIYDSVLNHWGRELA